MIVYRYYSISLNGMRLNVTKCLWNLTQSFGQYAVEVFCGRYSLERALALSGELYDRCAAYYDLFRGKYVLSLKTINGKKYRRSRCFWHTKTLKCW